MKHFRGPISKKSANVFWFNGAIFVLSLFALWFQNAPPALKALSVTQEIGLITQAALFVLSSLIGMVLTAVERAQEALHLAQAGVLRQALGPAGELAQRFHIGCEPSEAVGCVLGRLQAAGGLDARANTGLGRTEQPQTRRAVDDGG